MWKDINGAPFDRDVEVAVIEKGEVHAVGFACRRILHGWINAATKKPVDLNPTHWREWQRPFP